MDYIGSKEKLNKWIFETLKDFIPSKKWGELTFLDGCAGSGSVSKEAIRQNLKVLSNDIMRFSSFIVGGFSSISEKNILTVQDHIHEINSLRGKDGFFYHNYSEKGNRLYFSIPNARKIDAVRQYIEKIASEDIKKYLVYCGIEALSRVLNTTGVQAAYLKKLKPRALSEYNLKLEEHLYSDNVKVFSEDILSLLKSHIFREDIFYIDPPYNNRQYGPNYHLYETFARYDNPEISGKTGLRDWGNEAKSDFCYKTKCLDFLKQVINETVAEIVLISYSSDGLLLREEIENIQVENYQVAAVRSLPQKRYKSDNNRNNRSDGLYEYLFVLSRKGGI